MERQIRPKADPVVHVRSQLLVWPRMHTVDEELAIETNGGMCLDLLMVVKRTNVARHSTVPNTIAGAREEAILAERNGAREARFQNRICSQTNEVRRCIAPPLLKKPRARRGLDDELRAM